MERLCSSRSLMSISEETREESISTNETGSYTITKYDILTVFQAAPLVYLDLSSNKLCPIGLLDFDSERDIVKDSVKEAQRVDAKIDVRFEIATTDRLGAFLAKGESEILHFSCHGHPDYLFVENGSGAGQQLLVKDLKEWIAAGGGSLRFVFVSACHSRKAGEAFVEAGVPHVVCCQQDSQQLRNTAAVEFARAFYRALAAGKHLKDAFELARHGVRLCPHVEDEGEEFALLPENANHDVPIFFTKPLPTTFAPKRWCSYRSRMFPLPPRPFVGRNVDMFNVIKAVVGEARIVRVTGPSGAGKCSLVKAVGQYISQRNLVEDMFWLPVHRKNECDGIESWLSKLFDTFQDKSCAATFRDGKNYCRCRDKILDELHEKKALIIVDARRIEGTNGIKKLATFFDDLFQFTKHAKVIVIHRNGNGIRHRRFSCVEADIELDPLDFESTVSLFASLCQYAGRPDELLDLLVTDEQAHSAVANFRTSRIFEMLGEGVPDTINHVAKTILQSEFDSMLRIAQRPLPAKFKTRAALEKRISILETEILEATQLENYLQAEEIQESLSEMEVLRESLPGLATLKMMAAGARSDLDEARSMRNFSAAAKLKSELNSLNTQIQLEQKETPEPDPSFLEPQESSYGEAASFESTWVSLEADRMLEKVIKEADQRNDLHQECTIEEVPVLSNTRAGLEAAIHFLENALEEASNNNDFRQARIIDGKLLHLGARKEKLPSSRQLSMQISQLEAELKEAKHARHWDSAETLHREIKGLEKRLALENGAEREIHGPVSDREKPENGSSGPEPDKKARDSYRDPPIFSTQDNKYNEILPIENVLGESRYHGFGGPAAEIERTGPRQPCVLDEFPPRRPRVSQAHWRLPLRERFPKSNDSDLVQRGNVDVGAFAVSPGGVVDVNVTADSGSGARDEHEDAVTCSEIADNANAEIQMGSDDSSGESVVASGASQQISPTYSSGLPESSVPPGAVHVSGPGGATFLSSEEIQPTLCHEEESSTHTEMAPVILDARVVEEDVDANRAYIEGIVQETMLANTVQATRVEQMEPSNQSKRSVLTRLLQCLVPKRLRRRHHKT